MLIGTRIVWPGVTFEMPFADWIACGVLNNAVEIELIVSPFRTEYGTQVEPSVDERAPTAPPVPLPPVAAPALVGFNGPGADPPLD